MRFRRTWLYFLHRLAFLADYGNNLLRGAVLLLVAPGMLLLILVLNGYLRLDVAIASFCFLAVMSLLFIYPFTNNLTALTRYVTALAADAEAEAPDLSYLSNVAALQGAVEGLHTRWQARSSQLKTLLEESRLLIDTLPDAIVLLDARLHVVRTNRSAKQVFGDRGRRTSVEKALENQEIQLLIQQVRSGDTPSPVILFLGGDPVRQFFVHGRILPRTSGRSEHVMLVFHDISKQQQNEQMVRDFVANASHEIRTPLTAIRGYLETLASSAKHDPKALASFLPIMQDQAERLRSHPWFRKPLNI
jgi:two-component system, OmpR family, phosphate regulon sensor histidine kinase PhoR